MIRACCALPLVLLLFACGQISGGNNAENKELVSWNVSDDLQIEQISDTVWIHTSWNVIAGHTRFPSNGLIIKERDHIVLIDTAWGVDLTEQLLEWVEEEFQLPVDRVIATHFHDDRLGGASALAARGIPLLAQSKTIALATDSETQHLKSLGEFAPGESLRSGSLEVFYPGPAHSQDNVAVWLPDSKILFGGCAVKSGTASGLGNVADADLANWPVAIRQIQSRYPNVSIVVPGHGAAGDKSLLTHTLNLLEGTAE